ncbi:hypothetical protein AciPR4_3200 [Terriglobus saanensis SP1PR4]|uniref:HEAT domain containing protein n=2 Tax=Terriglobus saanensis TaxID=870903 RepID=E8V7I2_TERSS|nr:hypothetical protein AciPR4_3200 [Terriglobus saanensis SP1PR4]
MHERYRKILNLLAGSLTKMDKLYGHVNEITVGALSQTEVGAVLPLAFQCVHSPDDEIVEAGYDFLISVMLRFDSAGLLGPYIDDLGKLAEEKDNSRRQLVLLILGSLKPKLPEKAIEYLKANLESTRNSNQETLVIAASLLQAARTDAPTVHRVLLVVSSRSDADLTSSVIRQLGLSRIRLPEAVNFISSNLNQEDEFLRASAVDAASRLDKDTRAQFSSQLNRIASDPKETQYVRQQAAEALKP